MDVWNDYELLYYIRQRSDVALQLLYEKYEKMLWKIIHTHVSPNHYFGMDLDDFMQHARMSFYQSIECYREDRNAGFSTFLHVCVERKIKSVIRDSFRGNNLLFLDCVSMDEDVVNAERIALVETIENPYPEFCPVWTLNIKEESDAVNRYFERMKPVDKDIFELWRNGYSYREIASVHSIEHKYIDNTIQKIKRLRNKYQNQ